MNSNTDLLVRMLKEHGSEAAKDFAKAVNSNPRKNALGIYRKISGTRIKKTNTSNIVLASKYVRVNTV